MQKQVTNDVVRIGGISHWEGTIAPTYTDPPNAVQRFAMAQGRRAAGRWDAFAAVFGLIAGFAGLTIWFLG